jgi:twitching motility protein PilT
LHDEIRMQLSIILKGTISLRLLPRKDGQGRIPAYETMVVTPTIARLIRENRIREIQGFIDEGELFGMKSFKRSLVELVTDGLVEEQAARRYADSKDEFDLEMKGLRRGI